MEELTTVQMLREDMPLLDIKTLYVKYIEKGLTVCEINLYIVKEINSRYQDELLQAEFKYALVSIFKNYGHALTCKEASSVVNYTLGKVIIEGKTFKPNLP